MTDPSALRIAAIADVHFAKTSRGSLQPLLAAISSAADVLIVCGDLTHHGLAAEAAVFAEEVAVLKIPVLAVLGNHDFHAGEEVEIQRVLEDKSIQVLDGEIAEVSGVGFAGSKGFGGGFGGRVLEPWGENMVKQFVHESVTESLKLETALARLKTPNRIVLLHYSPVVDTVEGEPLEIYPFLGSSRLEEPINRFKVAAAFHGHAHHGRAMGRTGAGVPVFNVSIPLMSHLAPDRPPFRLFEVARGSDPETTGPPALDRSNS